MFSREELQHIRDTALEEAKIHRPNAEGITEEDINPQWRSVLLRLANAADHLDAMIARTQVSWVLLG